MIAVTLLLIACLPVEHVRADPVEVYWDAPRRPRRYLYVQQPPPPPRPVVVVAPPRPVYVQVRDPLPLPEPEPERVDPYDTRAGVIVGAAAGAFVFFGDGAAAPMYQLHVGVGIGAAEFGLRFDLAPGAREVLVDGEPARTSLYTAGAFLSYRMLGQARVHPIVGIGLETLFLNPDGAETGRAFGAVARVGLELAFRTGSGALALGLDVEGHQPLAISQGWRGDRLPFMSFGAHMDYRF